jgi:D-alanyl-D-alanine carboxypeptidase
MRVPAVAAAIALGFAAVPAAAAPELVVDLGTGRVVHAREADRPWHPASLTKLMTTYVALRAISQGQATWDSPVPMTDLARSAPPSRSGLRTGARLTLADALRVLMVKSANDVAVAVAQAISGDVAAFVARMNAESARLGMRSSRWANPHGLHDPAQVSTAHDLVVLARAIRTEFPQADPLFSIPSISLDGIVMPNHNKAVGRVAGIDGMKTGYICASGFNVVTTGSRDGRRVAVVLLGRDSPVERDARASLLVTAALAAASPGIGDLSSFSGSRGAPPARACGSKGQFDEDPAVPPEAMERWTRSFRAAASSAPPVPVSSLPPATPGAAPTPVAAPAWIAPAQPAIALRTRGGEPLAYAAPVAKPPNRDRPPFDAAAPKRF